jgi:hypothetical protein
VDTEQREAVAQQEQKDISEDEQRQVELRVGSAAHTAMDGRRKMGRELCGGAAGRHTGEHTRTENLEDRQRCTAEEKRRKREDRQRGMAVAEDTETRDPGPRQEQQEEEQQRTGLPHHTAELPQALVEKMVRAGIAGLIVLVAVRIDWEDLLHGHTADSLPSQITMRKMKRALIIGMNNDNRDKYTLLFRQNVKIRDEGNSGP